MSDIEKIWEKYSKRKSRYGWDPHPKHSIEYNNSNINKSLIQEFKSILDKAKDEKPMQKFFEKYPRFLIYHLEGGHGRWCIPKKSLGGKYIPDFIIGEKSSIAFEWYGVELESPTVKLFTSNGNTSKELNTAMKQIHQWRKFIENNIDYAKRPVKEDGLGFPDINPKLVSYIIIGRRENIGNENSDMRKHLKSDSNIIIHTYDWLLQVANQVLNFKMRN